MDNFYTKKKVKDIISLSCIFTFKSRDTVSLYIKKKRQNMMQILPFSLKIIFFQWTVWGLILYTYMTPKPISVLINVYKILSLKNSMIYNQQSSWKVFSREFSRRIVVNPPREGRRGQGNGGIHHQANPSNISSYYQQPFNTQPYCHRITIRICTVLNTIEYCTFF